MVTPHVIRAFYAATILFTTLLIHPVTSIAQQVPLHSSNPSARLFDDTIIVKYKETTLQTANPMQRKAKMNDIAAGLLVQHGITATRTLPILGIQQFQLGTTQQLNTVILALRNLPHIQYAEYNYRIILQSPDDPHWINGQLWGMTKINMNEAWQLTHGARTVTVAVIDSGIDYMHRDLAPNMYTWMDGFRRIYGRDTCGAGNWNPMDTAGHGTMVAGIIGAKGDNSFGGVGVNWDVKLLAVKSFCGRDGSVADAEEGIEFAMAREANVINASWRVAPPVAQDDIQILETAVRKTNCEENAPPTCRPALFVAAAGNGVYGEPLNSDANNGKVYPANFTVNNIIAVAASDADDNLWSDSHYGLNSVHIAAPGVNIYSTTLHTGPDEGHDVTDGTSMAAPHVAGCAAILQARQLASSGSLLTVQSLKLQLIDSADQIPSLDSYIALGRRLNCGRAVNLKIRAVDPSIVCPICGSDEILVQFKPGTHPSTVKTLNESIRVQVVRTLSNGRVLVKIPTGKSLDEIRDAYASFSEVESVKVGQ
jgi:thermitase